MHVRKQVILVPDGPQYAHVEPDAEVAVAQM
jgi:hypothetical protein